MDFQKKHYSKTDCIKRTKLANVSKHTVGMQEMSSSLDLARPPKLRWDRI